MLVLTSPRNWAIEVTALLMDVSCSSELNVASWAINSVSDRQFTDLPMDWTVRDVQLDSLGLSQVVFFLEEKLGRQLEEGVLLKLAEAETIGDFLLALRESLSVA